MITRLLAACAGLLVGCTAGLVGDIPEVAGPKPVIEPAPDIAGEPVVSLLLPKPWLFYSRPPELYGTPVLRPEGGTTWRVTGRWRANADHLAGQQPWVLMGTINYTWYRLTAEVAPWGRVHLWGQLPDEWVPDREAVPNVVPVPGTPWRTVPHSRGHVLEPVRGRLELRACPAADCPVLERPEDGQLVPVTGRLSAESGEWYRVEFRQQILWAEAASGRLAVSWAGRLRRGGAEAAGYRSCEPVVMFPPPPHTLCPVNAEGRFLDLFEREYDRLDPVFGRIAPRLWDKVPAPPEQPAAEPMPPSGQPADPPPADRRIWIGHGRFQFVLIGPWTPPTDPDVVCEPAFIVMEVSAPLHAGPDAGQPVLSTVHRYTPLPVLEVRGFWRRVAMAGIGEVPDHWIHEDQGRMGGWCFRLPPMPQIIDDPGPRAVPAAVDRIEVARSDGVLTVTWSPVPTAIDYHVTHSANGGASWRLGALEHPDTAIRIAGVDNGQTYIVGVRARDAAGVYGPWRNSDPSPPFHPQPDNDPQYTPWVEEDLPGLDYEWDLVFEDQSALWDWDIPDHGACHDALRAHLGYRPEWYGLRKATVVLRDPSPDFDRRRTRAAVCTSRGKWHGDPACLSTVPWCMWAASTSTSGRRGTTTGNSFAKSIPCGGTRARRWPRTG